MYGWDYLLGHDLARLLVLGDEEQSSTFPSTESQQRLQSIAEKPSLEVRWQPLHVDSRRHFSVGSSVQEKARQYL